jgi:hypothetical protein
MTNTQSFAARELEILDKTWNRRAPDQQPVILEFTNEILALCEKFGNSGQSGGSAPYTAGAICSALKHLLLQEPIGPVTGIQEEWNNCTGMGAIDVDSSGVWQNNRCSALFMENGEAYYLDAIIWKGDTQGESGTDWDTFSGTVEGIRSRQFIQKFPFTPKTFYIDVTREMLPEDWTEEPFYKNEFYDTKIFEETGVREWRVEKYRYKIKDKNQLDRVWKYYRKP